MFEIRHLTPSEMDYYDPTHNLRNLIRMVPDRDSFAPPSKFYTKGDEYLSAVNRNLDRLVSKYKPYALYAREMFAKTGRQGGAFNRRQWESIIQSYYSDTTSVDIEKLRIGRDLFISLVREKIGQVGRPPYVQKRYIPTFSGSPAACHKGTWEAETLGHDKIDIQRFYPTTPGQRRMRSKDRVIFMDACPNVRAQEDYLTAARKWLTQYFPQFFMSWKRDDLGQRQSITEAVESRKWFVSGDYQSMDINFRKRIAMELIYPVYEVLFPERAIEIGCHFEQNFTQPIFMGTYMYTGDHSLLSGANITNDFETLYTVILVLAAFALLQASDQFEWMLALGDDSTVPVSERRLAFQLLDTMMELSDAAGMIMHPDKSTVTQSEVTYCRKTYAPGFPRDWAGMFGAYPSVLCVNNLIQPEYPTEEPGVALVADLQRLDGLRGSPDAQFVLQNWHRYSSYDLFNIILSDDFACQNEGWRDWWYRLYDDAWNPATSWALNHLIRNHASLTDDQKDRLFDALRNRKP